MRLRLLPTKPTPGRPLAEVTLSSPIIPRSLQRPQHGQVGSGSNSPKAHPPDSSGQHLP